MKNKLTIDTLIEEAKLFCEEQSKINHLELLGVTDGKAIGTYVEHLFEEQLESKYLVKIGNTSRGIDLPDKDINTDIKVTSVVKPQSSCPFANATQKIYGLGYNLLIFVYLKADMDGYCRLKFTHCTFVEKEHTGDYLTTKAIREMVEAGATHDDIINLLIDKNVPGDEKTYNEIADEVFKHLPEQGYLTMSSAFQWRLKYGRAVDLDDDNEGIINYGW